MKCLPLVFLTLIASISRSQVKPIDSLELVNYIESRIDTFLADHNVPGAVFSMVKDGSLFYTSGVGYEILESKKKINSESSQFRVASITKTFTTIAIMQLVEQGKLDLHEDIRAYLSEDEYPRETPHSFTIHHLLTHTAGFENSSFRVSQAAIDAESLDVMMKTSLPAQIFEPGEVFYYSNRGYGILGLLIEQQSGMRYEDYIAEYILQPIGMDHSTVYQHRPEHPIKNPVQSYYWDGAYHQRQRLFMVNPAASTLNTTGLDMGKFMVLMLDSLQLEGQSIISKQSFELMTTRHYAPPIDFEAMGYGLMIENYKGYSGYNHGGGIDGFGSYYIFFPELDLGLFMSESGGEENAAYAFRVIYSILKEIIVERHDTVSADIPLDQAIRQAKKYAGRYQQTTVPKTSFERGEMLFGINESMIQHVGDGQLVFNGTTYKPLDHDTYQAVDGGRKIGFMSDAEGNGKYAMERIYWTLEKINWFQSSFALQLGLGISLLIIMIGMVIRPLIAKKKTARAIQWKSLLTFSVLGLLLGFGLLLIGYIIEIPLRNGTPMIYKIGLLMTTLGAILFAMYPVEIVTKWKQLTSQDRYWMVINTLGMALLIICFVRVNLIGLNYY